jgi:hypothetical protein
LKLFEINKFWIKSKLKMIKFTCLLVLFGLVFLIKQSEAQTDLCRYVVCQNGGRCSQTSTVEILIFKILLNFCLNNKFKKNLDKCCMCLSNWLFRKHMRNIWRIRWRWFNIKSLFICSMSKWFVKIFIWFIKYVNMN